jgi:hypothetical protein
MKRYNLVHLVALLAVLIASAGQVQAAVIFIGQFDVGDGPTWSNGPQVLSARETAALLFGGSFTDYAISTNPNTIDPLTVNHMAWVDGFADESYLFPNTPASEDFKIDVGPVGYSAGDFSAYVFDHDYSGFGPYEPGNTTGNNVNYVWRYDTGAAVPEPTSMAIFGLGALAMAYRTRRKSKA